MLYMKGMVIRKFPPPLPPNGHRKIAPSKFPPGLGLVLGLGLESGAIFRGDQSSRGQFFNYRRVYASLYSK